MPFAQNFITYLNKPAPSGTTRHAPNKDVEVMTNVIVAFGRIVDSSREQQVFWEQYNTPC
jgi:hypothetical protein